MSKSGFSKNIINDNSKDEDVDDYMSDDLIPSEDIKPGLLHSHRQKQEFKTHIKKLETLEKNKKEFKSVKKLEVEKRDEGLKNSIKEDNKGFAMLQKMGYKSGQALGKAGTGRIDPVEINLKSDRKGLGMESIIKEIKETKTRIREQSLERRKRKLDDDIDSYRQRCMEKSQEKFNEVDLRKSQRVCHDLDETKNLSEPVEKWFWPEEIEDKDHFEEEEEDEEIDETDYIYTTSEKLEIITLYLRKTHFYCIWCGVQYSDMNDMNNNCPGITRNDH